MLFEEFNLNPEYSLNNWIFEYSGMSGIDRVVCVYQDSWCLCMKAALGVVLWRFLRVWREHTLSATSWETCAKHWKTEDLSIPSPLIMVRCIHTDLAEQEQSMFLK